jgi:hypothetical protein
LASRHASRCIRLTAPHCNRIINSLYAKFIMRIGHVHNGSWPCTTPKLATRNNVVHLPKSIFAIAQSTAPTCTLPLAGLCCITSTRCIPGCAMQGTDDACFISRLVKLADHLDAGSGRLCTYICTRMYSTLWSVRRHPPRQSSRRCFVLVR